MSYSLINFTTIIRITVITKSSFVDVIMRMPNLFFLIIEKEQEVA